MNYLLGTNTVVALLRNKPVEVRKRYREFELSAAHVCYEVIQVSDNILPSVVPARLDKLDCFTGSIEVRGRSSRNEVTKIRQILITARQYFQRNQMGWGRDRSCQAGEHLKAVGPGYDLVFDP